MNNINKKRCFCYTCGRYFNYMGIARHRSMHRDKKEDCKIRYTNGDVFLYAFSDRKENDNTEAQYKLGII